MINTLSKLSSINAPTSKANPLRFNGSLPITIEVLQVFSMDRYKLLLGTREFTTKSHKKLEQGKKYWGSFGENKDGIITISNLLEKPSFLQNNASFLELESFNILKELENTTSLLNDFHESILENLAKDETQKDTFKTLSRMLLALKDGVVHLPVKHNGKPHLLQFKYEQDSLLFYIGFENLGPIKGRILKDNGNISLNIEVLFEKSIYFLKKELKKLEIDTYISLNKNINPLYIEDKLILNLQG